MSTYCNIGFDAYLASIEKQELLDKTREMIEEDEFAQAKFEVINKFYSGDLSWSTAEAMAKLWARSVKATGWQDDDAKVIAKKLDLDIRDMCAVLGDRNGFKNSYKTQNFWR